MGTNSMWGQPPRLTTDTSGNTVLVGANGITSYDGPRTSVQPNPMANISGRVTRLVTTPIIADSTTAYWPWIIRVDRILTAPLGKYYLYASTDHDAADGGIYLWYADAIEGPWTSYGLVYVDTARTTSVGAGQTETPSVVHDPAVGGLRMFYQQAAATYTTELGATANAQGIQSTLSCTSTDGITWTADPYFIVDIPLKAKQAGDGGATYFIPFSIGGKLCAYTIWGSGNYPSHVIHYCNGPLDDWTTDQQILPYGTFFCDVGDAVERYIAWNHCFAMKHSDGLVLIGQLSNFASGLTAKNALIGAWPLAPDAKSATGNAELLWSAKLAWESADLRSVTPYIENGVVYIVYCCKVGGLLNVGVLKYV